MRRRPKTIYFMVGLQVLFVVFDLTAPFITGAFVYYTELEFLMSYFMAILDVMLIIGFMRGSRWAWIFGLIFSGINIISYASSYLSNPVLFYALLLFMRLLVILCLRSRGVREYFEISRVTR